MLPDDLIPVNLWLSGRSYRIKVKRSEADRIRKAVKKADEKMLELKQAYSGKDEQDFLAMCLIMYATDSVDTATVSEPEQEVTQTLRNLSNEIDELLR